MKITVIGCGRWGSFIAWYLDKVGHSVSLYGVWMLYASDPSHLLVSALLYAPGTVFYVIARRETGEKIFPAFADKAAFAALIAMAAISLIFLSPKL